MPKLSIAMCGLSLLALITAAPALAASPLSGQNLTNSVGDITTNPGSVSNGVGGLPGTSQSGITDKLGGIPTDGSSIDTGSLQNSPGSLLPADELGGANAGVPLTNGVDPANWNLKKGRGETLVMTADIDLEKHGHPGGLAAQGVDSSQITEPLAFAGVMQQANAAMAQAGAGVPAMASGFTSLLGLGGQ
jgi:hypothetical protein